MDYRQWDVTVDQLTVGSRAQVAKTLSEADVMLFAGLSGDFNAIHINADYAEQTRFGQRVVHGILTTGLISAALTKIALGAIYLAQEVKFLKPVFIGDTIVATAEVTEIKAEKGVVHLHTFCTNQRDEMVIDGQATIMVGRIR
ncbi:MAG TPA: MaoC family dehydratase [Firmicutes bacterium]|nr:MaoC family dehydratase [Bacillota bacterium]